MEIASFVLLELHHFMRIYMSGEQKPLNRNPVTS
jgi:hypothetical protein